MATILTTICYLEANGQTLMLERNKKPSDVHDGRWVGIGGKFEEGESAEACVAREFYEETGLTLISPRLRGMIMYPRFIQGTDTLMFLFTATRYSGRLKEDCDEGDLHWIDTGKLNGLNLWEGDHLFLKWMQQDRFFSGRMVYEGNRLVEQEVTFY